MTRHLNAHFTAQDLDAWLDGTLSAERAQHLEVCPDCAESIRVEQELTDALNALPAFAPTAGFADRVMLSVRIPDPFALRAMRASYARIRSNRRSLAVAATLAIVLIGSMGASVAWSLANQDVLHGWGTYVTSEGSRLAWLGLRGMVSNLIEQPWYGALRDLATTPGRLAGVVVIGALVYLSGLLALRRLLAIPSQQVANAHG